MGFVTIHVQHGWKMESSNHSRNGLPTPYQVSSGSNRRDDDDGNRELSGKGIAKPPLSSLIRLTVPASVAQLVKYFNSTQTKAELQELEEAVRDVLCRLEMLVLASCIPDSSRFDQIRSRVGSKQNKKSSTSETTIKSSSEGRISALMLTRCRSKILREKALALLAEALDTNCLSTTPHETMHLQMLWVEMVQLFRHVLDNLRTQSFQMFHDGRFPSAATNRTEKTNVTYRTNRTDLHLPPTEINSHLESLLTSISLTMQRLDHIQDITGNPLPQSTLMSQSYACLLEDLDLCCTRDPFTYSLVSSIKNQVTEWIQQKDDPSSATPTKQQISLDLGVHVLSQVIRMTLDPSTMPTLSIQFKNVFQDLQNEKNWNSGKKLLTLLGTAALLNTHIINLFIDLMHSMQGLYWEWRFVGIGILGSIVLSAPSPVIRKVAMEQGLIPSLYFTNTNDEIDNDMKETEIKKLTSSDFKDEDSWFVRAAAVVALTEVYQQIKSNVHGLLAREVMQDRREKEKHPRVLSLLNLPKAKTPQIVYVPRLSTMFKHTSIAFAEAYVTLESEYRYMKGYLEIAEKSERALQEKLQRKTTIVSFNRLKRSKRDEKSKIPKLNHLVSAYPDKVTAPPQFLNIQSLHLSSFAASDYQKNYKRPLFNHDSYDTILPPLASIPSKTHPSVDEKNDIVISPSYISTTPGILVPSHNSPHVGTANRRKLFNPPRPFQGNSKKSDRYESNTLQLPKSTDPTSMQIKTAYYDEVPANVVKIPHISIGVQSNYVEYS